MSGKKMGPKPVETQTASDKASYDLTTTPQTEDWLASSLKQLYRNTVEEGIPDDMMALLDALDDTPEDADKSSSSRPADNSPGDDR